MSEASTMSQDGYQPPDPIKAPPLYSWPPRPIAAMRWILTDLLFPWGLIFIGLAVLAWICLTPGLEQMTSLEPGWMALIWLRNAALLTLVAGGLHWRLHIRRAQDQTYMFNTRWLAADSHRFLWRNQTRDNMFWSLASGCTVWSFYESLTLWAYAGDRIPRVEWSDAPIYLAAMTIGVFFLVDYPLLSAPQAASLAPAVSAGARASPPQREHRAMERYLYASVGACGLL